MNAHAEVSAPSVSTLQTLLDTLGGVTVGETYASGGQKKCEHFKPFGVPDDFTKRLIIHLGDQQSECDAFVRNFMKKDLQDKAEVVFADSLQQQKDGIDAVRLQKEQFDTELNTRARRINYLLTILHEEIVRQFPEADDKKVDHLFIDEDWTVGWLDHTNLHEEFLGAMFGGGDAGAQPDLFDHVMAMGPDGKLMSVDEALRDFPPEMAEAMKGDLSEIVNSVRRRSAPGALRSGNGLAQALAGIAASIARGRSRPRQ